MTAKTAPPHDGAQRGDRAQVPLAGWALAIAAMGTPATVIVLILGQGGAATAGAGAIGGMTVAAFATARAFHQPGPRPSRRAARRTVMGSPSDGESAAGGL